MTFLADEILRCHQTDEVTWLDLYDSGVPPSVMFRMRIDIIRKLASSTGLGDNTRNELLELCVIGLASYFEAFCKHLFAAIVNICPKTLERFASRRDCSFALSEVLHLTDGNQHRIGSMLSEHYDFGSAKSINALFFDLLQISPFSKNEAKKYSEFLNDRNLLVHHGGVYTFAYARQKCAKHEVSQLAHWDCLEYTKEDVEKSALFLIYLARKSAATAKTALNKLLLSQSLTLNKEAQTAIDSLDYFE